MDQSNVTVRDATAADAAPLALLLAQVFTATYGAAIPPPTLAAYLASAFAPDQVAAEIERADGAHLVAFSSGAIIGVSVLAAGAPAGHHLPGAVELVRLYVDEAFHGRGVGGILLDHTLTTANKHGHSMIWLCVWERNQRALAFYGRHSFVPFGRAPVFVGEVRFEDIVMRRSLHDC